MLSRIFRKFSPVLAVLVVLVFAGLYNNADAQVIARMTNPQAGSVVVPGQPILITWDVNVVPIGKKGTLPTYLEQEVYASFDGGSTYELITAELPITERSFTWTVPDLPGKNILIDIRCGNGVRGPEFFNRQPTFKIMGGGIKGITTTVPAITLNEIEKRKVSPGEQVEIGWNVNFENVDTYDVKVSFDEGLHMQKVDSTKNQSVIWTVPEGVSSSRIVFQVAAKTTDGRKFVTRIPVKPMLIVE